MGSRTKNGLTRPHFILYTSTPGNDYNHLAPTPYMTDEGLTINNPTAYTWYKELIVST